MNQRCFTSIYFITGLLQTSLSQVLMLVVVRKVMEKIFTLHELEVLDDLMPENIKKQKAEEEAKKKKDDDYEYGDDDYDDDDPDGKKVKINKSLLLMYLVQSTNLGHVPDRIGVEERVKLVYPEKTSRSKDENQQQAQPTYDAKTGNRTQATLVGGECSHHCAISAPLNWQDLFSFIALLLKSPATNLPLLIF